MLYIIIQFIHVLLILFIILAPFTNIPGILTVHIVSCISLLSHWYFNNSMCCLTLLEANLRNMDVTETFIHKLVNPIYKIDEYDLNILIWISTIILMFISLYKLYYYLKSKDKIILKDLFVIR